jgi:hypothetical protein
MSSSTYGWRDDTETRLVTGHNRGNPARGSRSEFAARLLEYAKSKGRPLSTFTHEDIVEAMGVIRPSPPIIPNNIFPNAAASLLTTVRDFAAFMNRVLNPAEDRVELSPEMRKQMVTAQTRINSALSWGLGWGLESEQGRDYLWHWGDNGSWKNFVLLHQASRSGVVVFTNGNNGMRVAEAIVNAASGHAHAAFDWL